MNVSMWACKARKPQQNNVTNSAKNGDCIPPIASSISSVSLNGVDISKLKDPPGAMPKTKPKSMWITWPAVSSSKLPLWRSLNRKKYDINE
eukprot:CAMPEP_0116573428 /NCGR_PEP_ID=MMETSP0397-20121206/18788_1 /TAXON_ID=216820 /ORGANISM="Cyclophora tenuis, Strain ECT3854" /LENGTH=90 /DNA_ID=CAMNT_0004101991 /DNA_START=206 /DNA_END=478 /DNA_ORIENTATION=-